MNASLAAFSKAELQQAIKTAEQLALKAHEGGDFATARKLYEYLIAMQPGHAMALRNLGLLHYSQGELERAEELLAEAVRLYPREARLHYSLGVVQQKRDDLAAAEQSYRAALRYQPDLPEAWENLGVALADQNRLEEAIAAHRRALRLAPRSTSVQRNLCTALHQAGETEESGRLLRQLLDQEPLNPDLLVQHAMWRLSHGEHAAWHEHEWRHSSLNWMKLDRPSFVPLPKWDGSDLTGRSICFYGEQGVGDEIMFAAPLPAVAPRAAQVTLLCEPRLVPLFARSMPDIAVVAKPAGGEPPVLDAANACELRCSLSSLPLYAGQQVMESLGAPYLRADPAAVVRWRDRLAAFGARLTVGISWRGGILKGNSAQRSIDLEAFRPLLGLPDVRFVNVQYGSHREAIQRLNATIERPLLSFEEIDPLKDMDGLAALLSALDLVISVDNSTVHLAGALGVPTWMLTPASANWRWQRDRTDNMWYDSVRLFRQEAGDDGDWQPMFARIAGELQQLAPRQSSAEPASTLEHPPRDPVPARAPTVLLLNDMTYWSHFGCAASSLALHRLLRDAGHAVDAVQHVHCASLGALPQTAAQFRDDAVFREFCSRNPTFGARIAAVPEVILNGDLQLRGNSQATLSLLYLAWIAKQRYGKRVSIINHSLLPGPEDIYAMVYGAMDFVAVNDARSAAMLARMGVQAVQAFDCLPLFLQGRERPTQREKRVVLGGLLAQDAAAANLVVSLAETALAHGHTVEFLTGANAFCALDDRKLAEFLQKRLRGRYSIVAATSEEEWLHCISSARLLVTGRTQHAIASACLGTPFVAISGEGEHVEGVLDQLALTSDLVTVSPRDPAHATARVLALLQDPQPAVVPETTIERLRQLGRQNLAAH